VAQTLELAPSSPITLHMVPSVHLPDAFARQVGFYVYPSGHSTGMGFVQPQ
jgi:hypothetical protein